MGVIVRNLSARTCPPHLSARTCPPAPVLCPLDHRRPNDRHDNGGLHLRLFPDPILHLDCETTMPEAILTIIIALSSFTLGYSYALWLDDKS